MTWRFVAIFPSRLTIRPLPSVVPALDSPLMSTTAGEAFATIDGQSGDDWPCQATCPVLLALFRSTIRPLPSVVPALDSPLMSTTAGEAFATIDGPSGDDWPFKATCPGTMAGSIDKAHTIRVRPTRKTLVMKGIRRFLIASE